MLILKKSEVSILKSPGNFNSYEINNFLNACVCLISLSLTALRENNKRELGIKRQNWYRTSEIAISHKNGKLWEKRK